MKKVIFIIFGFFAILLLSDYAYGYVNCRDMGDCIKCEDDDAYERPDGSCVSGGDTCVASNIICGY